MFTQAPSTKPQTNLNVPNPKVRNEPRPKPEVGCPTAISNIRVFDLFDAWCLGFGASRKPGKSFHGEL
jgi:hypothetical protein